MAKSDELSKIMRFKNVAFTEFLTAGTASRSLASLNLTLGDRHVLLKKYFTDKYFTSGEEVTSLVCH